jgi:cellobiose phosphorylase
MRFGHFDDERREYVVTRLDTPLPWLNYIGDEGFIGLVTATGGGYSFYRDPRLRRITRYRYQGVPSDTGARFLYLRDDDEGEYWSPTGRPTEAELDRYRCRVGLGYTIVESERKGISAEVRYFVPPGEDAEVWRFTVANHRDQRVPLSVFSCVEFALWDAQDDATNFQRNLSTGEVEVDGGLIIHRTEYRERRDHVAWFACSEPVSGFDTSREAFVGHYRGWERPLVVERGAAADSVAHGWAPIGSHHVRFTLEPGEASTMVFALGYHENPSDAKFGEEGRVDRRTLIPVVTRLTDLDEVDSALFRLRQRWDDLLDVLVVDTPDEHVDRTVNIWNPYQNMATFNLSRSASLFESGVGRGMGFRDSAQDLLGFVHMVPERARERLLDLAATQLVDGGAFHQYQPLTKRGNDAIGSGFNDDPLWLVLAVAAYLKETGDWGVLDEQAPYDNRAGSEEPLERHLERALGYTLDRLGPHGLPLIGRADWNDCLNLNTFSSEPGESFQTTATRGAGDVAESVFIAGLFVLAAREMARITERRSGAAARWREAADAVTTAVSAHGWDGRWFLRAYDAFGEPVGSAVCPEGWIFAEPQGMCVMAGIGLGDERAERALASVDEHLATEHGIMLLQPAYTRYRLELGEITSYPPGYKENAGIFCHTNPWIMIAAAILGDGDAALDYYLRINPSAREGISEIHRCEPYVYAQMIAGRDAPTHGEAKNSWLTGTAAWNYVAITQWILGIRPDYDGLVIDPVLPSDWEGFSAVRRFRGATYRIEAHRAGAGNDVDLTVDGKPIAGRLVGAAPAGATVAVRATVGSPAA